MGYAGKIKQQLLARKFRSSGASIKEIEKRLNVARSSVSLWVRDVVLTKKQIEKLYINKKTGGLKGSFVASRNKLNKTKALRENLAEIGHKEVGVLSKRDKFLIGTALYFAEGNKASENIAFSNSDPRAIKFMVGWFLDVCKIPREKLRCYLYIHDDLNEKSAKIFWSNLTNIPLAQFRKSYIVKNNKNRFRKSRHVNGVLRVSASDVNLFRKMTGWISGIFML